MLRPGLSENLLLLSVLPMMIQLPGKSGNFDSKMSVCSNKQLISKVESFLNSSFDLKQEYKLVLTHKH